MTQHVEGDDIDSMLGGYLLRYSQVIDTEQAVSRHLGYRWLRSKILEKPRRKFLEMNFLRRWLTLKTVKLLGIDRMVDWRRHCVSYQPGGVSMSEGTPPVQEPQTSLSTRTHLVVGYWMLRLHAKPRRV